MIRDQSQWTDPEDVARLTSRNRQVRETRQHRDLTLGEDYPTIPEFYRGRNVFITGASGFVGKVILEKLLRSCPDVGNIYVLLRTRRGQGVGDRVKAMFALPLFGRVRQERPAALDKVVPVQGDCSLEGLGLSPADRRTLIERVSIVIHSAASVRFDDPLKKAVALNTRSSRDIVGLAKEMAGLKVLVHISTAYCSSENQPTMERVYPTEHDWRDVLKYAELPDAYALDVLGPKFLGYQPNSYVFTKALSERVMEDASSDIPIVIVRPSIVVGAYHDPLPGWMDNLNGCTMLWAVYGKGVLRVMHAEHGYAMKLDLVPVDSVSNAAIAASWAKGTSQQLATTWGNVDVVNVTFGDINPSSFEAMRVLGQWCLSNKIFVFPGVIRYPMILIYNNKYMAAFMKLFYHLIFGALLDLVLVALKKEPMLMTVYRKLESALAALSYFIDHEFRFDSTNYWQLQAMLHPKDRIEFSLKLEEKYQNLYDSAEHQFRGLSEYALKEPPQSAEDLDRAVKRLKWLWIGELCWYIVLGLLAVALFARKLS